MSTVALFIKHTAIPGQRDAVMRVWERHMRPAIARNEAHEAYYYCYSESDPDAIYVYQQYSDKSAAEAFLKLPHYATYLREVELLLAGPPEVAAATPMWTKSV